MRERATSSTGEEPPGRFRTAKWLAVGIAIFVVATAGVGIGLQRAPAPASPVGPPAPVVNASFSVNTTAPQPLPPYALGINVRANYALGPKPASWINGTTVRLVRWPGGNLSDRMDPLAKGGAGVIYDSSGRSVPAAASLSQFVAWCRSFGGAAVLTLPGEIDNASYAAAIAREVTDGLGFVPTYWEIGNEPGLWTHWGIPWSQWNTSQGIGPTPVEYAGEVAAYITAVRSVDPTARFLGLPGVGTGASDLPWIRAVVAGDGPNLSGIAIHVYPAGPIASTESPAAFFATLEGTASISARVPADLAEIRSSCPSCRISLLADEIGSVTGTGFPSYIRGYDAAPYLAAEVVAGLTEGVASVDLWALQSTYPDSWANPSGTLGAPYTLYATFLSRLPAGIYPVGFAPGGTGLYGLAGVTATPGGGTAMVFLVNTNTTHAFRLSLVSAGFPISSATEGWTWSPGESAPSGPVPLSTNATSIVLPPLGLGLWETPAAAW